LLPAHQEPLAEPDRSKTNRMQGRCPVVITNWAGLRWCMPAILS
jgi:hypothetical protein